ncbi:hypothetical protein BC830DRAFT_792250 [Chytriomyces sp. MP71]|nr:hypothetical protein BC830DRAFT_792250 [Chytriomyces sp. MP71]
MTSSSEADNAMMTMEIRLSLTFSHLSAAICFIAILINCILLSTIFRHRSTLVLASDYIMGKVITILSCASVFHALYMLSLNEMVAAEMSTLLNLSNSSNYSGGPLNSPGISRGLSSVGYVILTVIFSSNLLLAIERLSIIRYKSALTLRTIGTVCVMGVTVSTLFVSSFILANGGVSWMAFPFPVPCNDPDACTIAATSAPTILFVIGLAYYVLTSVAVCVCYENSYFCVQDLFEKAAGHDVDSRVARNFAKLQRKVLLRCIALSIGLVLFYIPDIVIVVMAVFAPDSFDGMSNLAMTAMLCLVTFVPTFDPLWTPILVVLCQEDFKGALLEDFGWRPTSKDYQPKDVELSCM